MEPLYSITFVRCYTFSYELLYVAIQSRLYHYLQLYLFRHLPFRFNQELLDYYSTLEPLGATLLPLVGFDSRSAFMHTHILGN